MDLKYQLFFNYVGCKSHIKLPCDKTESCCSLTMWDVNCNPALLLNAPFCCSLTMWDVNEDRNDHTINASQCCSLTMWDVNRIIFKRYNRLSTRLFFNYVGCK